MSTVIQTGTPELLTGNSSMKAEGQFVRNGQTMAVDAGFAAVSYTWFKKTMSFDQGLEELEKDVSEKEDKIVTLSDVQPIVQNGRFVIQVEDRVLTPTEYALGQFSQMAGVRPGFVEDLNSNPRGKGEEPIFKRDEQDAQTLVNVFKNALRRIDPDKQHLYRMRKDGSLRAVLSTQYKIVDNRWLVEVLKELIPNGRLSHWRSDGGDSLISNVLIPDSIRAEQDSDYGGMVNFGNSEVGERRVSTLPSIFRAICMNGTIWGQKTGVSVRQVHRGEIDLDELRTTIETNLKIQIPLLPQGIDKLLETQKFLWNGSVEPLFAQSAIDNKLTKSQAKGLLTAYKTEPQNSLFGLINAYTRSGQEQNAEVWHRFDQIGGTYMDYSGDDFSRLSKRAQLLKAEEVDKVFAA